MKRDTVVFLLALVGAFAVATCYAFTGEQGQAFVATLLMLLAVVAAIFGDHGSEGDGFRR